MKKYKEAIKSLKEQCNIYCPSDGCKDCYVVTAIEALQIADKLEQAMTDEQTADCIIVDVECVNNKHDKEVWMNGYNQALKDVAGEANEKEN